MSKLDTHCLRETSCLLPLDLSRSSTHVYTTGTLNMEKRGERTVLASAACSARCDIPCPHSVYLSPALLCLSSVSLFHVSLYLYCSLFSWA